MFWIFFFFEDEQAEREALRTACPYEIPTLKDITKLYDSMLYKTDRSRLLSDIFEIMAIAISNRVDRRPSVWSAREKRFEDIKNQYESRDWKVIEEIFTKIYCLCSSVCYSNGAFADYLGQLFMQSGTSNGKLGQFFTPYNISKLCAKITLANGEEKLREKDIITLNDPCCGSGGMLLAGLDVLINDYGINYTEQVFISCGDIDARCVHMCYIQLSSAGVPAIVKQQNAFTRELYDVWKTPAYIFQYHRFRQFEGYIQNG